MAHSLSTDPLVPVAIVLMKTLLRFLYLLGAAVLNTMVGVLCIGTLLGLIWLTGTAVTYWTGCDAEGPMGTGTLFLLCVWLAIWVGTVVVAAVRCVRACWRKAREEVKP